MPLDLSPDPQQLAGRLAGFRLQRDDSGPHRVYRDAQRRTFSSVTYVLGKTSDRTELIAWLARTGTYGENMRGVAAQRGTLTHSHAEYLLKTARRLAINSANKRSLWKQTSQGLWRCPSHLTRWALGHAATSCPSVGFSARGYAAALTAWVVEHVTAIYLVEFASCCWVAPRGQGFAGTADGLLEIDRIGPCIVDWKTSQRRDAIDKAEQHVPQLGAYSLGLQFMTGVLAPAGCVVVLPRAGPAKHKLLDHKQMHDGRAEFIERFHQYCDIISS